MLAVLIALFAQTLAFGAHTARAADDARVAGVALSSIVGAPVWVCVSDDGAPLAPSGCHDACPLCRLADQSAALDAPAGPAELSSPPPRAAPLRVVAPPPQPASGPPGFAFARGPPRSL